MLKIEKHVELTGQSMIDGVQAEFYTAKINSKDPNDMTLGFSQTDKLLAKTGRVQCREDRNTFEETAYSLQDELIAEKTAAESAALTE